MTIVNCILTNEGGCDGFLAERRSLVKRLIFLFPFSFFLFHFSFSQEEVDTNYVYTNLETALKSPEKVYHLDLSKQKLEEFPMDIVKFTNLRTLNLFKNKIKTVPDEIARLKNLRELNIGHNKLTAFGNGICELTELQRLVLNQNKIESIPADIKNLKKLVYLDMWDNDLWFIPDEIAELKDTLKEFDLQNIQFNYEEQARIRSLLPQTKINWPPPCNCKD